MSLAAGAPYPNGSGYSQGCISQSDADLLVSRYAAVIGQYSSDLGNATVTAKAIAATNYTEQSDSANQLGGLPVCNFRNLEAVGRAG